MSVGSCRVLQSVCHTGPDALAEASLHGRHSCVVALQAWPLPNRLETASVAVVRSGGQLGPEPRPVPLVLHSGPHALPRPGGRGPPTPPTDGLPWTSKPSQIRLADPLPTTSLRPSPEQNGFRHPIFGNTGLNCRMGLGEHAALRRWRPADSLRPRQDAWGSLRPNTMSSHHGSRGMRALNPSCSFLFHAVSGTDQHPRPHI